MVVALLLCGAPSGVRAFGVSGFASASYPFTTLEVPLATVADQVSAVARALRGRSALENVFLPPEVRQAIDAEEEE
jgi:hypothetical protein